MSEGIDPDAPGAIGAGGRRALVAVAVGGSLGTLARYGVGRAIPTTPGSFPWSTFLVNVVGSLALGFSLELIVERWPTREYVRSFIAVGFIGGFTTFSTVVVEADLLVRDGESALGMLSVVASLLAGLVAVFAGLALARRLGGQEMCRSC